MTSPTASPQKPQPAATPQRNPRQAPATPPRTPTPQGQPPLHRPSSPTYPYPYAHTGMPSTGPILPKHDPLAAPDGSTPTDQRLLGIACAAVILPILCDRLVFAWSDPNTYTPWFDGFWLVAIIAITTVFYRTAHRSLMWCFTTIATTMLCAYTLAMHAAGTIDDSWVTTTFLVIPCLAMMSLQLSDGAFDAHHPWRTVKRWLLGWLSPFTKLNAIGSVLHHARHALQEFSRHHEAASSTDAADCNSRTNGQMTTARRVMLIIVIAVPLLAALTALLASSDLVFDYALRHAIGTVDISQFVQHLLIVVFLAPFCLSLLVQTEMMNRLRLHACAPSQSAGVQASNIHHDDHTIDTTIAAVVLGLVLALYALFCAIQFTFLFSGHQLPDGYTYSQYAREGFFQLLAVICVNLGGYALILCRTRHTNVLTGMLITLIAETAVMLASALWRLHLYIDAYGLTWLRLESMTFMWTLIAVLILCLVRLFVPRLPLATIGFVLVVVWYVALVLTNPNLIIDQYNTARNITDAI